MSVFFYGSHLVGISLPVLRRCPYEQGNVVFVLAAIVCAVHQHILLVVQQIFAVVTYIDQHSRPAGLLQQADNRINKVVGIENCIVVTVDEEFAHFVQNHFVANEPPA